VLFWQVRFQLWHILPFGFVFLLCFAGVVHCVGGAVGFSRLSAILSWKKMAGVKMS
jgi:hypothetical protein